MKGRERRVETKTGKEGRKGRKKDMAEGIGKECMPEKEGEIKERRKEKREYGKRRREQKGNVISWSRWEEGKLE